MIMKEIRGVYKGITYGVVPKSDLVWVGYVGFDNVGKAFTESKSFGSKEEALDWTKKYIDDFFKKQEVSVVSRLQKAYEENR